MIKKAKSKEKIAKLIEKYEKLTPQRKKSYNEADTRRDFIMPLFQALGWDVYNDLTENEVVEEETSISGRIDYSFRLNNITQFVLEAKAIPEDLDKDRWAKQAIEYGWNKGIPWVILTDFEGLKVFNSEWKKEHPRANINLTYKAYLEKFDKLWLLSKESFQENKLDKLLEEFGVTAKRESVNERLAKDLLEWRELLTNYFSQWNKDIKHEDIEEAVQRILDRLIFMRVVEDKEIEEKKLWQAFKQWEKKDYKPQNFIEKLVPIFRKFDKKYNSNLFQKHLCEDLYTTQEPFKKILPDLYGSKEAGVKYRFDAINVDVLGNVYEQYLGYVQGREGGKSKRKKQGIYYTPTYIVNYIVQNTLGKLLEEKSLTEIEKIKVLDPACGSGSFLIRAFDVLNEKIRKERGSKDGVKAALRKYRILTNNIYGVDLDPQAAEIARLNLLLKALEPNHKLPMLTDNIKVGNSLIDDRKINEFAFDWKKEFPKVFSGNNPGFDVAVGNPPWVFTRGKHISDSDKKYFNKWIGRLDIIKKAKGKNIQSGKLNLYSLFLLKSMTLLRRGGLLGFIVPNNILRTTTYDSIRKYILDNCKIIAIVDLGSKVFQGVTASSVILILQKEPDFKLRNQNKAEIIFDVYNLMLNGNHKRHSIKQKYFENNPSYAFNILSDQKSVDLSNKINKNSEKLGALCKYIIEGIVGSRKKDVSDKKLNKLYKPFLIGKDIARYQVNYRQKWIRYDRNRLHRARPEEVFLSEKIILQRISGGSKPLVATLDRGKYYTFASINNILLKKSSKYGLKYILGLINSSLLNWYYAINFSNRSELTVNISKTFLEQLPIKKSGIPDQKKFSKLVNKILNLNKKVQKAAEGSDKWNELKREIEKLDKKIDEEVYKLYGLTPEEIEIVEG